MHSIVDAQHQVDQAANDDFLKGGSAGTTHQEQVDLAFIHHSVQGLQRTAFLLVRVGWFSSQVNEL